MWCNTSFSVHTVQENNDPLQIPTFFGRSPMFCCCKPFLQEMIADTFSVASPSEIPYYRNEVAVHVMTLTDCAQIHPSSCLPNRSCGHPANFVLLLPNPNQWLFAQVPFKKVAQVPELCTDFLANGIEVDESKQSCNPIAKFGFFSERSPF